MFDFDWLDELTASLSRNKTNEDFYRVKTAQVSKVSKWILQMQLLKIFALQCFTLCLFTQNYVVIC